MKNKNNKIASFREASRKKKEKKVNDIDKKIIEDGSVFSGTKSTSIFIFSTSLKRYTVFVKTSKPSFLKKSSNSKFLTFHYFPPLRIALRRNKYNQRNRVLQ